MGFNSGFKGLIDLESYRCGMSIPVAGLRRRSAVALMLGSNPDIFLLCLLCIM